MAKRDDVPPEAYGAMMDQFLKNQAEDADGSDLKLSQEEAEKFRKSFQDQEFRKMFADYMDEISDPKHRAETDLYISQLEGDNKVPEGKELVKPRAVFVIKTRMNTTPRNTPDASEKLFINVVESDKIHPPNVSKAQGGTNVSLPLSVGPKRLEHDKKNSTVPTFDACFHPDAIHLGRSNKRFKDLICNTAIDQVEAALRSGTQGQQDAQVSREFHVLRGVLYKNGEPTYMMLAKDKAYNPGGTTATTPAPPKTDNVTTAASAPAPTTPAGSGGGTAPGKRSGGKGTTPAVKRGFLSGKPSATTKATKERPIAAPTSPTGRVRPRTDSKEAKSELIKPLPPGRPAAPPRTGPAQPNFVIKERGEFRPSDHMNERVQQPSRPKEVVVIVELPMMAKASLMDLDVSDKRFLLTAKDIYRLDLTLSYPVLGDKGVAKFDKVKRVLTATIPVQPPPMLPAAAVIANDPEAGGAVPGPTDPAGPEPPAAAQVEPEPEPGAGTESMADGRKPKATTSGSIPRPKRDTDHNRWVEHAPRAPRMTFDARPPPPPPPVEVVDEKTNAVPVSTATKTPATPPPAPAPAKFKATGAFTAAESFRGGCPGYVFKLGAQGLGYYADTCEQGKLLQAKKPQFEWAQTDITVTVLIQVEGIDSASVDASFRDESVRVAFAAGADGERFELSFRPRHAIDGPKCRFDVQPHNMIAVLYKSLPPPGSDSPVEGAIWDDLQAADAPPPSSTPKAEPAAAPTAALPATTLAAPVTKAPAIAAAAVSAADASATPAEAPTQFSNSLIFELD